MALHGSLKQFEGLFEFLSGLNRESTSEGYLGLVKIKHLNSLKSDFRFEVEIWIKKKLFKPPERCSEEKQFGRKLSDHVVKIKSSSVFVKC